MDIKKTHKKKKQMTPDFSSWLYTTDEDFMEDRNLFEDGDPMINALYDRVLKLCLRHGITKEQVSNYELDLQRAMENYIQCIEIEQQIAKELTLIHFAHQINFSDPLIDDLRDSYKHGVVPLIQDLPGVG
jgi:hypothetical protein